MNIIPYIKSNSWISRLLRWASHVRVKYGTETDNELISVSLIPVRRCYFCPELATWHVSRKEGKRVDRRIYCDTHLPDDACRAWFKTDERVTEFRAEARSADRQDRVVGRFVKMPFANDPPNHPLRSYYCDDCCQPDYADLWDGKPIREFYHDTERHLLICEPCMIKAKNT